uniref:Isopenicillin N synthase-like Fe(2+) 2OG dioxygenase domain-containing protein n=1 Tax=Salix viminalis TaxID=40686 RepID=A0A6N2N4R8_SALVM
MSSSTGTASPTLRSVTIPYADLKNKDADLSAKIEEGFGPNGLGILSISDNLIVKDSAEWCKRIPIAASLGLRLGGGGGGGMLANLPQKVKDELEDPHSRYNFGWSHGKEKLESGKPGIRLIVLQTYGLTVLCQNWKLYDAKMIGIALALCSVHPRIIACSSMHLLAGQTLKALGKLMHDVGLMVAYHCDQYGKTLCPNVVSKGMEVDQNESLKQILLRSRCHKGRLLYYFPAPRKEVVFGEGEIAYQIGETTEILSRGYLCATPHSVQAPKGEEVSGVDRSTFALFMQPDWDERLNFPKDMHIHKDSTQPAKSMKSFTSYTESVSSSQLSRCWLSLLVLANSCLTFGEYSEMLLDKYYHLKT